MKKNLTVKIAVVALLLVAFAVLAFVAPAQNNVKCDVCEAKSTTCDACGGTGISDTPADSNYYGTFMALAPPVIAIVLALVTKEVYSSLFIGVLSGALLYSNFDIIGAVDTIVNDGLIANVPMSCASTISVCSSRPNLPHSSSTASRLAEETMATSANS